MKKNKKVKSSNLAVIITGMEHSGTTFLANILNNSIPNAGGGFECGLLLSKYSPKNFVRVQPFYDWFCLPQDIGHWGFSKVQREHIISTNSWNEAYSRLRDTYSEKHQFSIDLVIDKTPAYCYNLKKVLNRTSEQIPVLVTIKNIYTLYFSFKKRNISFVCFSLVFLNFVNNLKIVNKNQRVFLVEHYSLVNDPLSILTKINDRFPQLNLDLKLSNNALNFSLNPLTRNYDLDEEYNNALKNITDDEKYKLDKLNMHLTNMLN